MMVLGVLKTEELIVSTPSGDGNPKIVTYPGSNFYLSISDSTVSFCVKKLKINRVLFNFEL